jgi:hypothetical protein
MWPSRPGSWWPRWRPGSELKSRISALEKVFDEDAPLQIEVELYHFKNEKKIGRRVDRVRRMNGW